MPVKKSSEPVELVFDRVATESVEVGILGTNPFIANRMSEKARQQLLLPAGRKNAAARAASLKHDPFDEFRRSPYRLSDPESPTLVGVMASAFKGAMAVAALDLPGASRAQIGRLVFVEGELVPLYGEPKLLMSVTRSADINKTPDIRTRAILPRWAAIITIRYVVPLIKQASVINLLIAAGVTAGVGDWRPEKGKGSYGQFEVTNPNDPRVQRIIQDGGRIVQERAMAEPRPYDVETEDLLDWYEGEYLRRYGAPVESANGAVVEDFDEEELEVLA